jgi:hypothetical protein
MTSFGYTLSSEERGPKDVVAHARRAEELDFEFVSISDAGRGTRAATGAGAVERFVTAPRRVRVSGGRRGNLRSRR